MSTRASTSATDLRLDDVATFLGVLRLGSIQGAARTLGVSASQVSKAVARLERHLGTKLLKRSERGVVPSEAGAALAPRLDDLLTRVRALSANETAAAAPLTVAASSFMSALFLSSIVDALPQHRVRSLEMPPGVAGAYASEPFFDIALTSGSEHWPESWAKVTVGTLRQGLFASPRLAQKLGPAPVSPARIRQEPFIVPIYNLSLIHI